MTRSKQILTLILSLVTLAVAAPVASAADPLGFRWHGEPNAYKMRSADPLEDRYHGQPNGYKIRSVDPSPRKRIVGPQVGRIKF